jgi:hypothetical protein
MFVSKDGAYSSEAALSWAYPQTLDEAGKAFKGQTL